MVHPSNQIKAFPSNVFEMPSNEKVRDILSIKKPNKKNINSNETTKPIELFEINSTLHQKSEAELLQFEESTIKSELDDELEEVEDNYHENIYYNIDGNHLAATDEDNIY